MCQNDGVRRTFWSYSTWVYRLSVKSLFGFKNLFKDLRIFLRFYWHRKIVLPISVESNQIWIAITLLRQFWHRKEFRLGLNASENSRYNLSSINVTQVIRSLLLCVLRSRILFAIILTLDTKLHFTSTRREIFPKSC